MDQIGPQVADQVRLVLGRTYDELLKVMIDLAVPPIFLMSDSRPRLVEVRDTALSRLQTWAVEHPREAEALLDLVPNVLRVPDVGESLLEAAPWHDYFRLPTSTFRVPSGDDPVFAAVPTLLPKVDDDGLLALDGLDAEPHGLFVEDFSLHYHQFLRRGFGSSIHYNLIEMVLGIEDRSKDVRVRLAIDERRLRRRDEHEQIEERDFWYGPPLKEATLDDPTTLGETVHGHPECGRSITCPYWAMSVRWTKDNDTPLKTVEIEEFLPIDAEIDGLVLARYLHAIRDTGQHAFVHCDGAVKAYDRNSYPTDLPSFPRRGKGQHYRKVFRLDGPMNASDWSHLTALWFRGNPLVIEYLAGLLD